MINPTDCDMCDVMHKNTSKKKDCNEKWERKPAAKYQNSCKTVKIRWSFYFS